MVNSSLKSASPSPPPPGRHAFQGILADRKGLKRRIDGGGGDRSGKQLEPELRKMTKDEVNEAGIHEVGD